jgi:Domain of unknown function (DUF397)
VSTSCVPWRTSAASNGQECVEVAILAHSVLVRHSKQVAGPTLQFSLPEWRAFLAGVHDGEFDVLDPAAS